MTGSSSFWLIRHAPTAAPPSRTVGHLDVPLSAQGEAAAERFADAFVSARPEEPLRLFTSDLARAHRTAAALAARWDLTPREDVRLRELCFGQWEGEVWAEVERSDPDALAAWMADWVDAPPPGGESFRTLLARAGAWLGEAAAEPSGPAVVVAHAGTLRALVCSALGLPPRAAFAFTFEHLRVGRLDRLPGDRWTLSLLGACPHALFPRPHNRTQALAHP